MKMRGLLSGWIPAVVLLLLLGTVKAGMAVTPQVAAGKDFTVTLRSDGTLWAYGSNDLGQLGDGSVIQRNIPVQAGLPGNASGWTAIAAGADHTVAIRGDGSLWAWGSNDFGQLGQGTVSTHLVPAPSPLQVGADHDWVAVAAGASCTLALKGDGTLWAWGLNNVGQLGNGDAAGMTQPTPVQVVNPGDSPYVAVSISNEHVLALQTNGSLWSWGSNQFGQLGIDSVDLTPHPTPVQVVTGDPVVDNGWTTVSAGGWHSLARQSDGTLWSWGRNTLGQLGNGSGSANNAPKPDKVDKDTNWGAFAAGEFHSLAVKRNGTFWVWGANNKGQLGIGGSTDLLRHSSPVLITTPAGVTAVIAIAAGGGHSALFTASGASYAWGDNLRGQLGTGGSVNNLTTSSTVPLPVATDVVGWVAVDASAQHTIARRSNGSLWVWGDNGSGQGGIDPVGSAVIDAPRQITAAANWSVVAGGLLHTAALLADGTLWSWGGNSFGQLGDGSTADRFAPQQITVTAPPSLANQWFALSAGDGHTLGLQADGSLWAWGDNSAGQLGDGTTTGQVVPVRIITGNPGNFDNNWTAVSAGGLFSVGLQADGTLWVWGDNTYGQFGIDPLAVASSTTPLQVINFTPVPGNPGFNVNWTAVAAGFNHLLGLQADGSLWGLGSNSAGQLGNGGSAFSQFDFLPVLNPGSPAVPFVAMAAGDSHSVALKADGTVWSMGNNTSGQLGIGSTDPDPLNPVAHGTPLREGSTATDWTAVSAGERHTVALKADGSMAVWGDNSLGQLGFSQEPLLNTPTALLEPRISVPASVDFGGTPLTGPYVTRSIVITNSGTTSLLNLSITPGGPDSALFVQEESSTCLPPYFLAPQASCQLDITFKPGTIGAKTATLTIATNDPVTPVAVIQLAGTGYVPFFISASAGPGGSISPSGSVAVPLSGSQLFTVAADPGNRIVDVVVDGISVGPVGSYLFSAVTANGHTVSATFAPLSFLDSWSWRNPLPTGHSLRHAATNGGGVHIAVGDYGTILRSADNGTTWTVIDNGGRTLNGVTFGAGLFVAVGSDGRVLTSPDGLVWTARHSGTSTQLKGVAYGNGLFVAVGTTRVDPDTLVPAGAIYTSGDGINWTSRLQTLPLNTALDLLDVGFGSDGITNVFVAVGQGGYLLTSADNGTTWLLNGAAPINPAAALPGGIGTFDFLAVHFAADTFVAAGASGQVFTSGLTAQSWAQHDILSFADLHGIGYGNSRFLAVGTAGEIWSSADGSAWTQETSGLENTQLSINGITTAGTGFLAVGDDGHLLTSANGTAWTLAAPQAATVTPLRDIIYANGAYTAVGGNGQGGNAAVLTSLNGIAWQSVPMSPTSNTLRGIAFGNGVLAAVGDSGFDLTGDPASRPEILTSTDNGASWVKRIPATTPATSLNLHGIAYGAGLFVAVGDWDIDTLDAVILTSSDGVAWTRRANPSPDTLRRVIYGNGSFIAVGGAGTVLTSADGIGWTDHSIPFGPEFSGVAAGAGLVAAVGSNSTTVYRSANGGATWTNTPHTPAALPTGVLRGIAYADGVFVAVAESGFIFSSADAAVWTTRAGADIFPFGSRDLYAAAFGNGRFMVVGAGGAVLQSAADPVPAALPAASLSLSSLTVGPVEIGSQLDSFVTLRNTGGSDLLVTGIDVATNPTFSVTASDCATVVPGGSCSFTVRYLPGLPSGSVTATTLIVISNDPASPQVVPLIGTAVDTTPPALTVTYGPAFYTNGQSIQIGGTVEAGATVTIALNTAATTGPVAYGPGGATWNSTISNLVAGANGVTVTATDSTGNQAVAAATVSSDAVPFVKRASDAATGSLIQPIYDTLAASDTIRVRGVALTESLLINNPAVAVTLEGGHDQTFSGIPAGMTTVNGSLTVRGTTLRVSRIMIR